MKNPSPGIGRPHTELHQCTAFEIHTGQHRASVNRRPSPARRQNTWIHSDRRAALIHQTILVPPLARANRARRRNAGCCHMNGRSRTHKSAQFVNDVEASGRIDTHPDKHQRHCCPTPPPNFAAAPLQKDFPDEIPSGLSTTSHAPQPSLRRNLGP